MHTGTFAITSLLLGQAVRDLMSKDGSETLLASLGTSFSGSSPTKTFLYGSSSLSQSSSPSENDPEYEQQFIGMILMLTFVVGFVQVIMSFLRVGGWASKHLLPDALVGGFNTAAVFHIGTSQLKHFLGIQNMPSPKGAFALLQSWMWIGTHFLEESNWYTVALGIFAIVLMMIMRIMEGKRKDAYELRLQKKELYLVQQRQAVSEAIVRDYQNQREQQQEQRRRWEEQQRRKSDGANSRSAAAAAAAATTTTIVVPSTISPYANSINGGKAASTISLRTVGEGDRNENNTFSSTPSTRRTLGDAELALREVPTVAKEHDVYVPIPDILLAVILLSIFTVVFSLDTPRSEGGWGIDVIGSIPKGLPDIIFPANRITSGSQEWMTWNFLTDVILPMIQPALLISVIVYVMSFSIAKQFGKRYGYKVDPNQEMLALGLASMGGSIFGGYACTGSLTRTAILSQSGGKTPLASMIGVATVILTLVSLTWCFERVPNVVLAAIVLVALQSLVMQITEPLKLWRLGQRKAALIWMVTFLGVLIVSVELGIGIEYHAIQKNSATRPHLESLEPVQDDNLLHWQAILLGTADSAYEGGRFKLDIVIPTTYPMQPPTIRFLTKICHPNVHFKTGEICLDILKSEWTPTWTLESICVAISSLLTNPEPSSPLNCDAANLLRCGDTAGYNSLVRMYTELYAMNDEEQS
ncbi:hypothetical protein BGZ65_002112 [Modicella reniformis]|uniref:UBC core domain-containing protein n=1 Tax=Modicella reniformis TaxID=1440133 RepID=A0A9P6M9T6_9FUNG|nr:hypothetical protein BGZ65_002112 [Modicella reniformis]